MEHVKISTMKNGYSKVVPVKGYTLVAAGHEYSEIVTKDLESFEVKKI